MGFHGLSMKVSFCHFFLLTLLACSSKDDPWSSLHGLQCLLGTLVSISCRAISAPTPEAPPPLPCTVMLLPRGTVSHTFCLCYSVVFFCCCCGFDFLVFNFFFLGGEVVFFCCVVLLVVVVVTAVCMEFYSSLNMISRRTSSFTDRLSCVL